MMWMKEEDFSLCKEWLEGEGGVTNLHSFLEMHLSESQERIKKKNPGQERLSLSCR